MTTSTEIYAKINELLAEKSWCYVGLRGMYEGETTGKMHLSRVWEDGNMTAEMLNGTCAINLGEWWDGADFSQQDVENAMKRARMYGDGNIGIITGSNAKSGEDTGEVILADAECIFLVTYQTGEQS